ncbi:hypothetical protein ABZS86_14595 [Streptomyces sp. NPDC005355]|uniref:hypothetical protein n=1 Tax=Streptomyces sp. NPDC005355 TaxID=3157038 RepID=UPI00339E0084
MTGIPEFAFALFLEHGLDCPTCRTSDRPCDTGQELLRNNAGRPGATAPHSGAPGRCDCCGRDQKLATVHESSPTGPGRTRYVCQGCAPRPFDRERIPEGTATVLLHVPRREQQSGE